MANASCLSGDDAAAAEYDSFMNEVVNSVSEGVSSLFSWFAIDGGETIEEAAAADTAAAAGDEPSVVVASSPPADQEQAPIPVMRPVMEKKEERGVAIASPPDDITFRGSSDEEDPVFVDAPVTDGLVCSDETPGSKKSSTGHNRAGIGRRRIFLMIGFALGAIVLIVVGAVLGSRSKNKPSDADGIDHEAQAGVFSAQGSVAESPSNIGADNGEPIVAGTGEDVDEVPSNIGANGESIALPLQDVSKSPGFEPAPEPTASASTASIVVTENINSTTASATDTPPPSFDTFSFYVMGDAPYNKNQMNIVHDQIVELSEEVAHDDTSMFLMHVGDALNSNLGCKPSDYAFTRDLLVKKLPHLPSFIIPGDNDWRDCVDRSTAWERWKSHFMALETNWNQTTKPFLTSVVRQPIRRENFAFTSHGVLFMGVHVLGGGNIRNSDVSGRMDDNEAWIDEQVQQHATNMQSGRIRAVIVFGHAMNAPRLRLLEHMKERLSPLGLPVLYFKGDKHTFEICGSFQGISWDNFTIVQVEQGGNAPPIRVTVQGTTPQALQEPFGTQSSNVTMLADFINLDQRGGLYSWAVERQSNACGGKSRNDG